jgi:hypothetical protein
LDRAAATAVQIAAPIPDIMDRNMTFQVFRVVIMNNAVLQDVVLVRAIVSEECVVTIFRIKRISELGTTLAVTSN